MEKRVLVQATTLEAHPSSEADVQALLASIEPGACVRVRGAFHSEEESVRPDRGYPMVLIFLDRMVNVGRVDPKSLLVDVEAGASLGGDPEVTGAQADPAQSVCHLLQQQGYALPITGGITHQTISGFMGTGADGGSTTHSFWSAVQSLTLVDGLGRSHTIARGDPQFDAVSVSLGLLGVVTKVQLKVEPSYKIFGMSSVQREQGGDFDLFAAAGSGKPGLSEFLSRKPYTRALWWPQPGVERVELWEAERYDPKLHGPMIAGRPVGPRISGLAAPAVQIVIRSLFGLLDDLQGPDPERAAAAQEALTSLGAGDPTGLLARVYDVYVQLKQRTKDRFKWPDFHTVAAQVVATLQSPPPLQAFPYPASQGPVPQVVTAYSAVTGQVAELELLVARLIDMFIPLTPTSASAWTESGVVRRHCVDLFLDDWHTGLPMDNEIDDDVLPVTFTELWLPLDRAHEALRALRTVFRAQRLGATGTFCIELYAAKQNPAWLSMAHPAPHDAPMPRIDPFFCDNRPAELRNAFFQTFWDTLEPFGARAHWGKALPAANPARTRSLYPRLDAFLALRGQLDPKDLFLSSYWKRQLTETADAMA